MKYLLQDVGLDGFLKLVEEERLALKYKVYEIDGTVTSELQPPAIIELPDFELSDWQKYDKWLTTNVFQQKQTGYFSVGLKIANGDIKTPVARQLIQIINELTADEIRLTNTQGILLKYVPAVHLPYLFQKLNEIGLAEIGFESTADITSCPGTDTCNLGISNSTDITRELEKVIYDEYPEFIYGNDISIKISGCINSCGQHAMAAIGFHGSSMKKINWFTCITGTYRWRCFR